MSSKITLKHRPRYDGGSTVNLMSSLAMGLDGPSNHHAPLDGLDPKRVAEARHVVVLLVDGLGSRQLDRLPEGPLKAHWAGDYTSVFPTTTASAVSTFLTGLAPAQHAITGWFTYLRELGAVWTILPFVPRALPHCWEALDLPASEILDLPSFSAGIGVEAHIVSPEWIVNSSYSRATAQAARRHAYEDLDGLFATVHRLVSEPRSPRRYIYAYWPEVDALAHRTGVDSPESRAHFHALDQAFGHFLERLKGLGVLVVATADHGLLDTAPDRQIQIEDHPELASCLALPLCGEGRAAYCYLRPGTEDRFQAYVERELAHACQLLTREDLLELELFGFGPVHPELSWRIGDYCLLMRENYIIKDRLAGERPYRQIGVHGGLSPEEVYVPLILAEPD